MYVIIKVTIHCDCQNSSYSLVSFPHYGIALTEIGVLVNSTPQ